MATQVWAFLSVLKGPLVVQRRLNFFLEDPRYLRSELAAFGSARCFLRRLVPVFADYDFNRSSKFCGIQVKTRPTVRAVAQYDITP